MLFAVHFEDDPRASAMREKHMAAHLAFLTEHAKHILAAGPLLQADQVAGGGLWLVEAKDHEQVRALVETDPFWPTGLRRSVRIAHWKQVFRDGAVA